MLTDGPKAQQAKELIATGARKVWSGKRTNDGYDQGSGTVENSPKARMAATMQRYTDEFERVPVLVLPCLVRYRDPTPFEGASVFPAVQNLLLAARALGYGGVLTGFQALVEPELRELLEIPEGVFMAGTITIGKPEGGHGPVRRRPLGELIYGEGWERDAGLGRRSGGDAAHPGRPAEVHLCDLTGSASSYSVHRAARHVPEGTTTWRKIRPRIRKTSCWSRSTARCGCSRSNRPDAFNATNEALHGALANVWTRARGRHRRCSRW